MWLRICITYIYIHTHLCILLKCARVSFDIYYLPTFPVVPSQIVHDIDVYHVGCYIHATWYVVLDVKSVKSVLHLLRCIGTRCLQKGVLHWCASAPTQWALLCLPVCYKFGSECFLGIIIPEKKWVVNRWGHWSVGVLFHLTFTILWGFP